MSEQFQKKGQIKNPHKVHSRNPVPEKELPLYMRDQDLPRVSINGKIIRQAIHIDVISCFRTFIEEKFTEDQRYGNIQIEVRAVRNRNGELEPLAWRHEKGAKLQEDLVYKAHRFGRYAKMPEDHGNIGMLIDLSMKESDLEKAEKSLLKRYVVRDDTERIMGLETMRITLKDLY